jgi:hypothetical protein
MSRLHWDIARCVGGDCPLKESCLRFLDSGPYQTPGGEILLSFIATPPFETGEEGAECPQYWEAKE